MSNTHYKVRRYSGSVPAYIGKWLIYYGAAWTFLNKHGNWTGFLPVHEVLYDTLDEAKRVVRKFLANKLDQVAIEFPDGSLMAFLDHQGEDEKPTSCTDTVCVCDSHTLFYSGCPAMRAKRTG